MIKAKCVRACTWQGRFWRVGMIYEGDETPPIYFEIIEDETQTPGTDTSEPLPDNPDTPDNPDNPDNPDTPGTHDYSVDEVNIELVDIPELKARVKKNKKS